MRHPGMKYDQEKLILFANTECRQMLSMKQGSIIKGWGYHRISLFIHFRLNLTCGPNILTLPDSYEAQLSEYIQFSHKQSVDNLYWTKGSRGQVRSSVKRALERSEFGGVWLGF